VQPVAADKGKEGGKKGAALRVRAVSDHVSEFADLEGEKCRAEPKRDQGTQICAERFRELTASDISPQVVLETSRQAVSIATVV